jgi:hypothetical protein
MQKELIEGIIASKVEGYKTLRKSLKEVDDYISETQPSIKEEKDLETYKELYFKIYLQQLLLQSIQVTLIEINSYFSTLSKKVSDNVLQANIMKILADLPPSVIVIDGNKVKIEDSIYKVIQEKIEPTIQANFKNFLKNKNGN